MSIRAIKLPRDPFAVGRHLIEEHGLLPALVDGPNTTGDDLRHMHGVEHNGKFSWQHKRPHHHGRRLG